MEETQLDRRSQKERMLAGELYNGWDDELGSLRVKAHDICRRYNALLEENRDQRRRLLDELVPGHGEDVDFTGPIYFDYGCFTRLGDRVYANFNFTVLDICPIEIGDNVMIGPNVTLAAPIHPLRWQERNLKRRSDGALFDYEYGAPITIGPNCWLASNVTVAGGVTIGSGSVIGAGSVVTRDIPADSFAVGVPCRVVRKITEADRMDLPELG